MNKEIINDLLFIAQFIESNKDPKGFSKKERESILADREKHIRLFAAIEMALKVKDPSLTHSDLLAKVVEAAEEVANMSGEPSEVELSLIDLFEEKEIDSFSLSDIAEEDSESLSQVFNESDGEEGEHFFEEVYLFNDRLCFVYDGLDRDFGYLSEETQNKIYEIISKEI